MPTLRSQPREVHSIIDYNYHCTQDVYDFRVLLRGPCSAHAQVSNVCQYSTFAGCVMGSVALKKIPALDDVMSKQK